MRKKLKEIGVEFREHGQHHGRPAQVRYGQKIRCGRTESHLGELRVIKAVMEMQEGGLSLRKIAKVLTNFKVPTKCRGKKWHPQMIKRIVDRELMGISDDRRKLIMQADSLLKIG